ncbi:chymotrypsin inhibitor 3-like [Silene latifolia]|uniref:chymotrypsin inhibitor 3-like n=1 Tax=Silene latifolia TaxID=37657 RepID=UPI003D77EFE2
MSSFLFLASITLVLLSILPVSSADRALDSDGDPIINGREYYIIPISGTSGLTYTQKHFQCPLYITKEKTENSPGTPVKISVTINIRTVIYLDEPIGLAFKSPTPCDDSPEWKQTWVTWDQNVYITTGGVRTVPDSLPFFITETDMSSDFIYALKFSVSDSKEVRFNVGLHENGLLGLTEYPILVKFKKAFNVLELSTS